MAVHQAWNALNLITEVSKDFSISLARGWQLRRLHRGYFIVNLFQCGNTPLPLVWCVDGLVGWLVNRLVVKMRDGEVLLVPADRRLTLPATCSQATTPISVAGGGDNSLLLYTGSELPWFLESLVALLIIGAHMLMGTWISFLLLLVRVWLVALWTFDWLDLKSKFDQLLSGLSLRVRNTIQLFLVILGLFS